MTVFGDPVSVTGDDPQHADDEDRFLTMGTSLAGRSLVVSHTDRGDLIRGRKGDILEWHELKRRALMTIRHKT